MGQWFMIILAADLVASVTVAVAERIDWSKLFKKKRKRGGRRKNNVVPLRKVD